MSVEIHEIWETVKRILEILDVIYHQNFKLIDDEEEGEADGEE